MFDLTMSLKQIDVLNSLGCGQWEWLIIVDVRTDKPIRVNTKFTDFLVKDTTGRAPLQWVHLLQGINYLCINNARIELHESSQLTCLTLKKHGINQPFNFSYVGTFILHIMFDNYVGHTMLFYGKQFTMFYVN